MTRPRPTTNPTHWLRSHPRAADLVLAIFITAISLSFHLVDIETTIEAREPTWWTALLVIASVFPIAWRRTSPIGSGLVVVATQIVSALIGIEGSGFLGVVIALYSIGAYTNGQRRTRSVWAIAISLGLLFVSGLLVDKLELGNAISSTFVLVTAFVLGDNVRRRRDKADGLVERAERAEREQMLIAQQQVHAERTRIARELHDVVAHSVSVMVIQAAAARRNLSTAPDVAEVALGNIESTGRQTMTELRGILGVLREETPAARGEMPDERIDLDVMLAPQPTTEDLTALVESSTDLPIRFEVQGRLDDLSSSVALTAHRVVQEAITNIRRHAGAVATVTVSVVRDRDQLTISITDDGRGAAADDLGPGFGVIGMHERVAAIGGTIQVGPRPGGGWSVDMSIPVTESEPVAEAIPEHPVFDEATP